MCVTRHGCLDSGTPPPAAKSECPLRAHRNHGAASRPREPCGLRPRRCACSSAVPTLCWFRHAMEGPLGGANAGTGALPQPRVMAAAAAACSAEAVTRRTSGQAVATVADTAPGGDVGSGEAHGTSGAGGHNAGASGDAAGTDAAAAPVLWLESLLNTRDVAQVLKDGGGAAAVVRILLDKHQSLQTRGTAAYVLGQLVQALPQVHHYANSHGQVVSALMALISDAAAAATDLSPVRLVARVVYPTEPALWTTARKLTRARPCWGPVPNHAAATIAAPPELLCHADVLARADPVVVCLRLCSPKAGPPPGGSWRAAQRLAG